MKPIKSLQSPRYTAEEQRALIDFVLALKKSHIQQLLKQLKLARSGTKSNLRETLQSAIDEGSIGYEEVIEFLDSVTPWEKQHVFLYKGPSGNVRLWKETKSVTDHLRHHRVHRYFNARLPLILPEQLTLSCIEYSDQTLRVTAVQKRDYDERAPEHDEHKEALDGTPINLRAYVHHVSRTLVAFEWDITSNTAMLQISQLPSDKLYEEVSQDFIKLAGTWLDLERFTLLDVRPAIQKLHELEGGGQPEARSHGIHYRTLRGRRLSAQSPSARDSVLGEIAIDDALTTVRKNGVGHLGNFYWLAKKSVPATPNPLEDDVHLIIVGYKSRINFPTSNPEAVVRYVLQRVRALS